MRILRVGDPHAKVANLEELRALVSFVVEQAKLHRANRIELLGDLFHTHNVIRLEVLEFWTWALDLLSQNCETVVLVGNHDLSGNWNSNFSALTVFSLMNKPDLHIIDKPTQMGVFGYVPYTHDSSVFIDCAKNLSSIGCKVLVCHQTIEGSKYESGMYAPDGISSDGWSDLFSHIVSGHIHSEQNFGNFIYPGTARWDSVVDANRRKGIWLYNHDDAGKILSTKFIGTEKVCSPIRCLEWTEGSDCPTWAENERIAVELIGSSVWVGQQKEALKNKCSIKTKITDSANPKTAKRDPGKSFEDFMRNMFVSTIDRDELLKYAREMKIV